MSAKRQRAFATRGRPAAARPEISPDYVRISHSSANFWRTTLVSESRNACDARIADDTSVEVMDDIPARTA
ncbi:hypothetical protein [Burkholderia sp. BCC1977]|uniref:hypothetical protein n=1 Tax=Burkholderia sp. BCC1977 TaxID=2817440 RepID=UPI002ABDFC3E|nr:hypothetical protein [Burkholderia sp. BCC1977]